MLQGSSAAFQTNASPVASPSAVSNSSHKPVQQPQPSIPLPPQQPAHSDAAQQSADLSRQQQSQGSAAVPAQLWPLPQLAGQAWSANPLVPGKLQLAMRPEQRLEQSMMSAQAEAAGTASSEQNGLQTAAAQAKSDGQNRLSSAPGSACLEYQTQDAQHRCNTIPAKKLVSAQGQIGNQSQLPQPEVPYTSQKLPEKLLPAETLHGQASCLPASQCDAKQPNMHCPGSACSFQQTAQIKVELAADFVKTAFCQSMPITRCFI